MPAGKLIEAWGEWKSLSEWARDPRAAVGIDAIRSRIDLGWSNEPAISTPETRTGRPRKLITAFGETKYIYAFAKSPRCVVTCNTLRARISRGWPPEKAITTPAGATPNRDYVFVSIWGERKTIADWAKDSRSQVGFQTLYSRIFKRKWHPEKAMTLPSKHKAHPAFRELARRQDCSVDYSAIARRYRTGMSLEAAVTLPTRNSPRFIQAFGEVHTFTEWLRITGLSKSALFRRLERGMSPEDALTKPVGKPVVPTRDPNLATRAQQNQLRKLCPGKYSDEYLDSLERWRAEEFIKKAKRRAA